MPQKPLDISTPLFYPRAEEQQHHFRVSSRVMPMPPGYTKVFGFAPTWCTKECLTRKCRAFFCCSILRRHDLVHRQGYSNRAAARSAVRNATVRRSLARGRVPDGAPEKAATNVAAFLLHHSLWDGLALRASARVRLAGTGR